MAIKQELINNDALRLQAFLAQYEGILYDSVGVSGTGEITCDINNETVVSFLWDNGDFKVCPWYNNGESSLIEETITASAASSGATLVNKLDFAYGTDHGFMLHFTYDAISGNPNLFTTILVAKGTDGYPYVVIANPGTAPSANDLTHQKANIYHYPDTSYLEFNMCQFDTAMQTLAVPFASYGNISVVNYAPNACWFPVSAAYAVGFSRMAFQEVECITNGYWMVNDKQDEQEGGDD